MRRTPPSLFGVTCIQHHVAKVLVLEKYFLKIFQKKMLYMTNIEWYRPINQRCSRIYYQRFCSYPTWSKIWWTRFRIRFNFSGGEYPEHKETRIRSTSTLLLSEVPWVKQDYFEWISDAQNQYSLNFLEINQLSSKLLFTT